VDVQRATVRLSSAGASEATANKLRAAKNFILGTIQIHYNCIPRLNRVPVNPSIIDK
jgi:hypothetical protein